MAWSAGPIQHSTSPPPPHPPSFFDRLPSSQPLESGCLCLGARKAPTATAAGQPTARSPRLEEMGKAIGIERRVFGEEGGCSSTKTAGSGREAVYREGESMGRGILARLHGDDGALVNRTRRKANPPCITGRRLYKASSSPISTYYHHRLAPSPSTLIICRSWHGKRKHGALDGRHGMAWEAAPRDRVVIMSGRAGFCRAGTIIFYSRRRAQKCDVSRVFTGTAMHIIPGLLYTYGGFPGEVEETRDPGEEEETRRASSSTLMML